MCIDAVAVCIICCEEKIGEKRTNESLLPVRFAQIWASSEIIYYISNCFSNPKIYIGELFDFNETVMLM